MTSTTFFLLFIPILAIVFLALNLLLAPHNPYAEKNSTFECGFHSFLGQNRTQFSISFFIFALLFLLFDLEILLVYPYVVSAYSNGIFGLIVMLIFFLALTLGFVFELGKGALKIDSKQLLTLLVNKQSHISTLISSVYPLVLLSKIIEKLSSKFTARKVFENTKNNITFRLGLACIGYAFFFLGLPASFITILIYAVLTVEIIEHRKEIYKYLMYTPYAQLCIDGIVYVLERVGMMLIYTFLVVFGAYAVCGIISGTFFSCIILAELVKDIVYLRVDQLLNTPSPDPHNDPSGSRDPQPPRGGGGFPLDGSSNDSNREDRDRYYGNPAPQETGPQSTPQEGLAQARQEQEAQMQRQHEAQMQRQQEAQMQRRHEEAIIQRREHQERVQRQLEQARMRYRQEEERIRRLQQRGESQALVQANPQAGPHALPQQVAQANAIGPYTAQELESQTYFQESVTDVGRRQYIRQKLEHLYNERKVRDMGLRSVRMRYFSIEELNYMGDHVRQADPHLFNTRMKVRQVQHCNIFERYVWSTDMTQVNRDSNSRVVNVRVYNTRSFWRLFD